MVWGRRSGWPPLRGAANVPQLAASTSDCVFALYWTTQAPRELIRRTGAAEHPIRLDELRIDLSPPNPAG
jgi:hypothetical protein